MEVETRLREIRMRRGISAVALAGMVGVSRQTIYSIEDGSFVPNTVVSLQLSQVLGVTVEDLFSVHHESVVERVDAELLPVGRESGAQSVRVCHVNGKVIAVPSSAAGDYLPPSDGIVERRTKQRVVVQSASAIAEEAKCLLVAGCDPALSLLAGAMQSEGFDLVTISCASRQALNWLKERKVHGAGTHLLDSKTGDYNVAAVRRMLPAQSVRLVTFATWEQGLVVAHDNPKNIRCIADLGNKGITLINREKGSGSRDLLDRGLREAGVQPGSTAGYDSVASGHLAAARAVASGAADCCIAPRSAARCFGLHFIPLAVERFDLAFAVSSLHLAATAALLQVLNTAKLRRKLGTVAGYGTAHTGDVLI